MKIPKTLLRELLKEPKIKEERRQRRIINKFGVTEPVGSLVWLSIGNKVHIIHALGPTYARHDVFPDKQKAEAFWAKEITVLDERCAKRLEELNSEKIGTRIPPSKHWWGYVGFTVDEKLTNVFWGSDGLPKFKCPNCGNLLDADILNDIPGVEDHIETLIFDPGRDFDDRFQEGGARGTDCECNPGKYMKTKSVAVFEKRLLSAALKAREKFWKNIEQKFGKNKFERDKYLESPEFQNDRKQVIEDLFLKFKGGG